MCRDQCIVIIIRNVLQKPCKFFHRGMKYILFKSILINNDIVGVVQSTERNCKNLIKNKQIEKNKRKKESLEKGKEFFAPKVN